MAPVDLEALKRRVVDAVDERAGLLLDVSHRVHGQPELLFEERFASRLLASTLAGAGFDVELPAFGLDTAFVGRSGPEGGPAVAVLCEYDALPGVGHACGHNVIAAAGLGAALAAGAVAPEAGGRLVALGTPAEEGGGGKVVMGERGAFAGLEAALMVHPAGVDLAEPDVLAIATFLVDYRGQGAHAAAAPHRGRNALDAAVLGYNAVAALRQHMESTDRVHGVFLRAGDKPNIVPDHTVAEWYVRSASSASLRPLKERVLACLEAGAAAAGCSMEVEPTCPEYSDLRTNPALLDLYRSNSERLGRPVPDPTPATRVVASTDMGNVSHLVPALHPMIKVAPADVALHTAEFARWAVSEDGDRAVLDGAKAMAMTVVDLWLRADVRSEVRAAFEPEP